MSEDVATRGAGAGAGGRPSAIPEHLRGVVEILVYAGTSRSTIVDTLFDSHGISVTTRTLQRRIRDWGLPNSKRPPIVDTPLLRQRIVHAFHVLRLTDNETSTMLNFDGYNINARQIAKYRKKMGLYKRVEASQRVQAEQYITEVLRKELDDGNITDFGRRLLYVHMRQKYNIVSRDRLYNVLIALSPEAVEMRRLRQRQHHIPGLRADGPGHTHSMDAHCKLEHWGFQVYACIDHFSRFIVWIYIGVSGRSQASVWAQYVRTVLASNTIPRIVQTDRGRETRYAADAHLTLRRQTHSGSEPLTWDDCFRYGTSKMNQRIETWWRQLFSCTGSWREFFEELSRDGDYVRTRKSDRIALLFVYMPILRQVITEYVDTWNTHRIRKQKNRPHTVGGVPFMLYYYPEQSGFQQRGIHCPPELVTSMQSDLEGFDIHEYLPQQTMEWCHSACIAWIQPSTGTVSHTEVDENQDRLHPQVYRHLRDELRAYFQLFGEDGLHETQRPGTDWRPDLANERLREEANEPPFEGDEEG